MQHKLIVALDFATADAAMQIVDCLSPELCAVKIGSELFTSCGPKLVSALVQRGFKVFLDLKFHDIPTTVAKACSAAAELGVWMVNVHAAGGEVMLTAAREALAKYSQRPLLIAVTVLTSMQHSDFAPLGYNKSLTEQVLHFANLAAQSGLDGVVSSAYEVAAIKQLCGNNFLTVTPGIRNSQDAGNDQKRVMTPQQAIALGSDYLVVGRPITAAKDPVAALQAMMSDA